MESSGDDASCRPTSSDGGRCVGLDSIVLKDWDEIPLELRLCTPFLLPLTFEESSGFAKLIEDFSTNHKKYWE